MSYSPLSRVSKNIVVDANLTAAMVIPIRGLETVEAFFLRWAQEGCDLYAPEWWLAEVVSVLRQHVYRKVISPARAHDAVKDLFLLDVNRAPLDALLCQRALDWAETIQHSRIYDAIYLALAEQLNAEFWTADRRLINAAHTAGADWAHWIGEAQ
ncbi:MAG: type II toxin-antitoxin system VapC family toxin [Chloroflexota bacterium]